MPTQLKSRCPHCDAIIKVNDTLVGKRVRCPSCKEAFEVSSMHAGSGATSLEQTPTARETMEVRSVDTMPVLANVPSKSQRLEPSLGKLGRFELREVLGQGAFGRVYKAYDPQLDRFVALKVPTFGPDQTHKVQRFLSEAKAAAKLRHPNIVPTYESGQVDGQYFIASQFVAGQPLSTRIDGKPVDSREAADWVRQLAEALAYAHKAGIVHRDIKPDNIMLDEQGVPQIMDFGLAKRLNEDLGMTTDGSVMGTPAYMPPEQARGDQASVGPHSDQYSLGVVLYELLTGQRPFEDPPHVVIAQVIGAEPPAPLSLNPAIPKDLAAICQKAMSKEASNRYDTCTEMALDVNRWLRGDSTLARPSRWHERIGRWARREPKLAILSSAVIVLLLAGMTLASVFAVTSQRSERRLAALLTDLRKQSELAKNEADRATNEADRASTAEQLAQSRASEAIAQRDRADELAKEANQNLRLANERADELAKAISERDTVKLESVRVSESAKQSSEEKRQAEFRVLLAEATEAVKEQRYEDARTRLDACPSDLRNAAWRELFASTEQTVQVFSQWTSAYAYFAPIDPKYPDENKLVIDGEKSLDVVRLSDGKKSLTVSHTGSRSRSRHITLFTGKQLVIIYDRQLVICEIAAPSTKQSQSFTILDNAVTELRNGRLSSTPKRFFISDDLMPFLIHDAGAEGKQHLTCYIFDRTTGDCWEVGVYEGRNGPHAQLNAGVFADYQVLLPKCVDFYWNYAILENATQKSLWVYWCNDWPKGEPTKLADISIGGTKAMAFTNGTLALAFPDRIELWQINSSGAITKLTEWPYPFGSISLVTISLDRQYVATYSQSGQGGDVIIHHVPTGKSVHYFSDQKNVKNLEFDRQLTADFFSFRARSSRLRIGSSQSSPRTQLAWISDKGLHIWRPGASAGLLKE